MVDKAINQQNQSLVWFAHPRSEHRKFSRTWCLNHGHQSEGKNTVTFCELNDKCPLTGTLEDSEHQTCYCPCKSWGGFYRCFGEWVWDFYLLRRKKEALKFLLTVLPSKISHRTERGKSCTKDMGMLFVDRLQVCSWFCILWMKVTVFWTNENTDCGFWSTTHAFLAENYRDV